MIELIKSTFYNEKELKKDLCEFILSSKKLSMGPNCKEFEKGFSKYQNRTFSIFFNSGSSANLALMQSLLNMRLLKKGDNVGFSALTWATNVMPIIQMGLIPIPIDINPKTLNIDSEKLLDIKEEEIKALFITNALGFCGDLENIKRICEEDNIVLLEDNCESLGSTYKGRKLGNFGLASTFSFFVGHHLSTIEGGMVCTDNQDLYEMLLRVRSHGWSRDMSPQKKDLIREKNNINKFFDKYTFYSLAYNIRPTEISGFIGKKQLKYLDEITHIRSKFFKEFNKLAKDNKKFVNLSLDHMENISNFAYPLIFKNEIDFEEIKNKFIEADVEIRPIIGGSIINQPFFKEFKKDFSCPNAEKVHKLGFYFPNNPELNENEKEIIKNLLK